jgi:hypothetical protein
MDQEFCSPKEAIQVYTKKYAQRTAEMHGHASTRAELSELADIAGKCSRAFAAREKHLREDTSDA